jgi:hypothetical protein
MHRLLAAPPRLRNQLHLLLNDEQNLLDWLQATPSHHLRRLIKLVEALLNLDEETRALLDVNTPNACYVSEWIIARRIARSTTANTATLPPPATSQNIVPEILIQDLLVGLSPQDAWGQEPTPAPLILPTPPYSPLYNPTPPPPAPTQLPSPPPEEDEDWDPNDLPPLQLPSSQQGPPITLFTDLPSLPEVVAHNTSPSAALSSDDSQEPPSQPTMQTGPHHHLIMQALQQMTPDQLDMLEYTLIAMTAQGLR